MEKDFVLKILGKIDAVYGLPKENREGIATAWYQILRDEDERSIAAALVVFMKSDSRFAPKPGELIALAKKITAEKPLEDMEAWELVARAISNGIYGSVKEFNNLPPLVQKAVGGSFCLREWADLGNLAQVRSQFITAYRKIRAESAQTEYEDRARSALSAPAQEMLQEADPLQIEE